MMSRATELNPLVSEPSVVGLPAALDLLIRCLRCRDGGMFSRRLPAAGFNSLQVMTPKARRSLAAERAATTNLSLEGASREKGLENQSAPEAPPPNRSYRQYGGFADRTG
jgi:hypothetical protein